jgi:hypothetical protein
MGSSFWQRQIGVAPRCTSNVAVQPQLRWPLAQSKVLTSDRSTDGESAVESGN